MTVTVTIAITGDDAKFPAVLAALGGAAPASGALSAGSTAPAFTESANGSVISTTAS